jgi:hypothetical protein
MNTTGNGIDVEAIASRMVLAQLTIGAWSPVKRHKRETAAENERHGTSAARVSVVLSNHPSIEKRASLAGEARREHERLTLPTIGKGLRMLPAASRLRHSEVMAEFAARDGALVAEILAAYESERAASPARLGTLHDARLWPAKDVVAARHKFETRYLPCPLEDEWRGWIYESAAIGVVDVEERLREALERVRDRCAAGPSPTGREPALHATVFSNLAEVLALVPGFDVGGKFTAVTLAAADVAAFSAAEVKEAPELRSKLAARADEVLAMLGGVR